MRTNNKPKRPPQKVLDKIKQIVAYDPVIGKLNRGTIHNSGYVVVNIHINGERYQLAGHHIAWFLYYGVWPTEQLDHKNRDKAANWINNLRYSDGSAQQLNTERCENRTLPYGVDKDPNYECYIARTTIEGNRVYLGTFGTAEEAGTAVRTAKEQRANQRPRTYG